MGLCGSPMNAPMQGVLGGIMAWQRPDAPSAEQEECLPISRSAIYLLERPMVPARRDRPKAIREIPEQTCATDACGAADTKRWGTRRI